MASEVLITYYIFYSSQIIFCCIILTRLLHLVKTLIEKGVTLIRRGRGKWATFNQINYFSGTKCLIELKQRHKFEFVHCLEVQRIKRSNYRAVDGTRLGFGDMGLVLVSPESIGMFLLLRMENYSQCSHYFLWAICSLDKTQPIRISLLSWGDLIYLWKIRKISHSIWTKSVQKVKRCCVHITS